MNAPGPIRSRRLELRAFTPQLAAALDAGDRKLAQALIGAPPPPELVIRPFFRSRLLMDRFAWPRMLVALDPGGGSGGAMVVGDIGFHEPPYDGWAEVGYSVFPAHRRRGYATEAVAALFDWACREHGVRRFRASVSPTNEASLGVVGRLGFRPIGEQIDGGDGLELVFEVHWPPA